MAVRLVVFGVVRHEVVKAEPAVTRHEVDALEGMAEVDHRVWKQAAAAVEPRLQSIRQPRITTNEGSHRIAKAAVPLQPCASRKCAAELITRHVPSFGDQSHVGQHGVGLDSRDDRRMSFRLMLPSSRRVNSEARSKRKLSTLSVMKGEETEWHVAPVVALQRIELEDKHQLHCGDAQFLEIQGC